MCCIVEMYTLVLICSDVVNIFFYLRNKLNWVIKKSSDIFVSPFRLMKLNSKILNFVLNNI